VIIKKVIYSYIFFFSLSLAGVCQSNVDLIVKLDGDTINCQITLINDQNIFYSIYHKKSVKSDFISLNRVKDYYISRPNIASTPEQNQVKTSFPYNSSKKMNYGIKIVQQINPPIFHTSVLFSTHIKNHNLYLGPSYTMLSKNYFGDDLVDDYDKYFPSINFGYRYLINSSWEYSNIFVQLDFSIYNAKYKYYGGKYIGAVSSQELVVENCASVGINYKASNQMELFCGIGFGSTQGFFLMVDEFIFHSYFGLEYKFNRK